MAEATDEGNGVPADDFCESKSHVEDLGDVRCDIDEATEHNVGSPIVSDGMDWGGDDNYDEVPSDGDDIMGSSSDLLPSAGTCSVEGGFADELVIDDDDRDTNGKDEEEKLADIGGNEEYSKEDQRIMEEFQKIAAMDDISKPAKVM